MSKKDNALEEMEICSRLEPKDSIDFYCLALAYATARNNDMAFEMIEKAIRRDLKRLPRCHG